MNLILNRADQFDIESYACRSTQTELEWWKLRTETGLFLSGPCALGVAVNIILGSDPVAHIDVGWIKSETISNFPVSAGSNKSTDLFGSALILQVKE